MNQRATTRSSDATLVAACLRGDRASFVEIVERHQALVCAVAYQGIGDFAAAEDVAQDTFVTAWKKLATLREPDKLRQWLTRIAGTLAVDWLRKNGPRRLSAAGPDLSHLPDAAPTPDAAAVSREEAAMVWQALEALPEASRLPLILFYRERQSIAAVAAPAAVAAAAFTAGSAGPATAAGAKTLTTVSAVMTATQVSIAAAPAPLESRDLRLSIMSLPLELMQPALDIMDARRRKHTASPSAASPNTPATRKTSTKPQPTLVRFRTPPFTQTPSASSVPPGAPPMPKPPPSGSPSSPHRSAAISSPAP